MRRLLAAVLVFSLTSLGGYGAASREPDLNQDDFLRLNTKITKFMLQHVKPGQPRQMRLSALVDSLFSEKGLGIEYGNSSTKTAVETFRSRSGNCLSFTMLFVAMARHLGLEAYFMEVREVTSRDLVGELIVSNHHMFAEVELDNGVATVDFLPGTEKQYNKVHRISDARALAHFFNNLGAESLEAGDPIEAQAYFKKATETSPDFGPAWTNLGVAFRRTRQTAAAEMSYETALELDPGDSTALSNLAGLYLAEGRVAEATPLLQRVNEHLKKNPYHHLRLGAEAQRIGDFELAFSHLKEAVRRDPGAARLHVALAELYLETGDEVRAQDSFRKALRASKDEEQRATLERRLNTLASR